MNILVLAGGYSTERNVSLSSGSLITAALRRKGHKVFMLDVYMGCSLPEDPMSLFTTEQSDAFVVDESVPDLKVLKESRGGEELIGKNVLELCKLADSVYVALHGAMGENGQLQATLDNFGIKYTGSGYIGSMLAMDKDISKRMMRDAGVKTPDWIYTSADRCDCDRIERDIGYPCVVKPVAGGSSVGVSIVNNREELKAAFDHGGEFENNLLVERMIKGRELTCGILEGRVLPPVEIIPKEGFYDYKNKYQKGATTEICPAEIDEKILGRISEATKKAFAALRLSGYSRFDFILDGDGECWCLEANTLPGMTPTSLFPQEAAAVGIGYDELCEMIALSAINKK